MKKVDCQYQEKFVVQVCKRIGVDVQVGDAVMCKGFVVNGQLKTVSSQQLAVAVGVGVGVGVGVKKLEDR